MKASIPSAQDLSRAMGRGALAGLKEALPVVSARASAVAPYERFRGGSAMRHHLRDAAIIIGPTGDGMGSFTGAVAFQAHSNAKNSKDFSYARARHEGYYYVTEGGERNYAGRGRRVPTAGIFQYRHAVDPNAEHRFLYHAARSSRLTVRNIIGKSIAASLAASL